MSNLISVKKAELLIPNSRSAIYKALKKGKIGRRIWGRWWIEPKELLRIGVPPCEKCGSLCKLTDHPCKDTEA